MSVWNYRINIKQHLSEEEDVESMKASYKGIKAELAKLPPGIVQRIPANFERKVKLALKEEDAQIFNLGLDSLYDWADEYRVWMGP